MPISMDKLLPMSPDYSVTDVPGPYLQAANPSLQRTAFGDR
jgi:hypothetical protein